MLSSRDIQSALVTLYFSLIHCHFNYAIEIWSCASTSIINKLYLLQKNAIRIISHAKYNAHTEPLFKKLNILKLPDLINVAKVKFMHNFVYNKLPSSFHDTWICNRMRRLRAQPVEENAREVNAVPYQLRNEDDIYEPLARSDQVSKFPLFNYPKIWNALSLNLKSNNCFNHVSNEVIKSYLDNYQDQFVCARLFCPACLNN
jgi:hypothetical protein